MCIISTDIISNYVNLYRQDLFPQSSGAGIWNLYQGISRGNFMQEWYIPHNITSVGKVCISLELFIITHSSKKYVKGNILPNCNATLC
jgi:hypothetical protein